MEPAPLPEHQPMSQPPVIAKRNNKFKALLTRTNAFTAEYSVFLIALGIALSNAAGLVYIFFGLIVDAMHGGTMSAWVPTHMFTLWLLVTSAVALPLAAGLWSRVQGDLAHNNDDGDIPKGAAKGFRTFWIIISILGMAGMLIAALYAPVAAALAGGSGLAETLLAVTLPSLVAIAISGLGIYIVTRPAGARSMTKWLLWGIVGLTVVLFTVNYLWSSNLASSAPSRTTQPTTRPAAPDYDPYDELYDDSFYEYTSPSLYR